MLGCLCDGYTHLAVLPANHTHKQRRRESCISDGIYEGLRDRDIIRGAMADTDIPKVETYAEGEPIPPVDPEDVKRFWHVKPPWRPGNDVQSACSPGADTTAVFQRWAMIDTLTTYNLLTPWKHGEDLDDAVFRVAARLPLHAIAYKRYKIPGDELHGFDPNAFVQRLIEETGISHVWETVATKVSEGGRTFSYSFVGGAQERDPDAAAKHGARQILWEIWKRFSPSLDEVVSHNDKEQATHIVATFFANFLLDNIDLVRQLEDAFRDMQHVPLDPILSELERKAQHWGV